MEQRALTLMTDNEKFLNGLRAHQVLRLERKVMNHRTGVTSGNVVHGITSCGLDTAPTEQLLTWTRHYLGIDNGLHSPRDITLREVVTCISQPTLPRAIAAINNFVVGLASKLRFSILASVRRTFNASIPAQVAAFPYY